MKKYISLFLAVLMLLSLLAGCGGGKTNDGDGTRTLVLRNSAGLSTNDPHATTNTHDYTVFENIYEGLYDLNEATGGYDLRLAEKVEANDDATEYIVTLKQGVKFHDGSELTAQDVAASITYSKTCPEVNLYNGSVEKIEKVDDYTVKITTPGRLPEHHGRRQLHSRHRQLFGQQYAVLSHRCLPQQVHRWGQYYPAERPRGGCPHRSGGGHCGP